MASSNKADSATRYSPASQDNPHEQPIFMQRAGVLLARCIFSPTGQGSMKYSPCQPT